MPPKLPVTPTTPQQPPQAAATVNVQQQMLLSPPKPPNLEIFSNTSWVHSIRERQREEAEEYLTVGREGDLVYSVTHMRRKRSRSASRSSKSRDNSPSTAAARSDDKNNNNTRPAATGSSIVDNMLFSSSPAAGSAAATSQFLYNDPSKREPLQIEKLLKGGLGSVARAYSTSMRFRTAPTRHSSSPSPPPRSSLSPNRRRALSPSASLPPQQQQQHVAGRAFELFPGKYRGSRIAARNKLEKARSASRRKRDRILRQLQRDEEEAERLRLRGLSAAVYHLAPEPRSASEVAAATAAAATDRRPPSPSASPQPPSLLRPLTPVAATDAAASPPRLYPNQFTASELESIIHNDNNKYNNNDTGATRRATTTSPSSLAFSFFNPHLDPAKKVQFLLENVETPPSSDSEDYDDAEVLLYEKNQLLFPGYIKKIPKGSFVAGVYFPEGEGEDEVDADVEAKRLADHVADTERATSQLAGRSVTTVSLTPAGATGGSDGHSNSNNSRTQSGGQQQNNNNADDIGALLLRQWHNFHAMDQSHVTQAALPWDSKLLDVILNAPDAEAARRLVLLQQQNGEGEVEQQQQKHK